MSMEDRYYSDTEHLEVLSNDVLFGSYAERELVRRSTLHKEIRSYEISLWTLQDEFITVLKWSDASQRGGITDAKMTLNVDGTQNLEFSIPMYLTQWSANRDINLLDQAQETMRENPIWYDTLQENLITDTRKVKVIFNKGEENSAMDAATREQIRSAHTFEFLIVQVEEEHSEEQLTCKVTCESLAFHELGKIGYKYSLSNDEFLADDTDWRNTGKWYKKDGTEVTTAPKETVQYWCELCNLKELPNNTVSLDPTEWYYDIQMNWDSFESDVAPRSPKRVYEEAYPTSWDIVDNYTIRPQAMSKFKEKERPVESSESNIYNITQAIAEAFEIHCRYTYIYDDNYRIKRRVIVFFNNYMHGEDSAFTLNYPYSSKSISRSMDSTDLTTKMYVTPQTDDSTLEGEINIMYCDGNKSKEEYLLNFDYMKQIDAITQEQYDEIAPYEIAMRRYNDELHLLSLQLAYYSDQKIEKEAKQTIYKESIALDTQQIKYNSELYEKLAKDYGTDGYLTRDASNPYSTYVHVADDGESTIRFNDQEKGIDRNSIHVYKDCNTATNTLEKEIDSSDYEIETDEYGAVSQIKFYHQYTEEIKTVYLSYRYQPKLYYDAVLETWKTKLARDQQAHDTVTAELRDLAIQIENAEATQKTKVTEKAKRVRAFERMMGPALREGYWQPQDYDDYGDPKTADYTSFPGRYLKDTMIDGTVEEMVPGWDAELFEEETKIYYTSGINEDKCYYPCIDLSRFMNKFQGRLNSSNQLSFIFNNNYYRTLTGAEASDIKNLVHFTVGADAILGFLATGTDSTVKPVLILTGAQNMTDEQINFMLNPAQDKGRPRLGIIKVELDEYGTPQTSLMETVYLTSNDIYWESAKCTTISVNDITDEDWIVQVQPRIKCSSTRLKIDISNLTISYAGQYLTKYTDFSVATRITNRKDNDNVMRAYPEYFITLKPETLMNIGTYTGALHIDYRLSNATMAIYNDALEVLKENAFPKVAYEIEANMLDIAFMNQAYTALYHLVMINDTQLKFEHVFGYISQVELNLDKPWEDVIEVKNYKTKFEDLFSTIVAQTEDMQRNTERISAAVTGGIPLNGQALQQTLASQYDILSAYLDSHFDTSEVVKEKLTSIMGEAGKILGTSRHSLSSLMGLNLQNADILGGFLENVAASLIPNVISSTTQPTEFKVGDIWNKLDENGVIIGRYVATADSEDGLGGYTRIFDGSLASLTGASLNVDAVEGTVEILAQNKIDMKSGGNIYIAANENVDILGNRAVNIGGTRINLASCGGSTEQSGITLIASMDDSDADDALQRAALANLVEPYRDQYDANDELIEIEENPKFQSAIDRIFKYDSTSRKFYLHLAENIKLWFESSDHVGSLDSPNYGAILSVINRELVGARISKVIVYPKRIDMTSASIYMKGSSKILAVATDTTYQVGVSAVSIDANDGVWIGSNKGIRLYGGNVLTYNESERRVIEPDGGASVELNSKHLLLGFANTQTVEGEIPDAAAIELTDDYIIIAKGEVFNAKTEEQLQRMQVTGQASGLIGAKFTNESIGFAVANEDYNMGTTLISAVLMDKNGVTIGSGGVDISQQTMDPDTVTGSYVRVASTGIEIGALGDLYLNTNNVKLQSDSKYKTRFALGYNLQNLANTTIQSTDRIAAITQMNSDEDAPENQQFVVNLVQNENGLFVRGAVYATTLFAIGLEGYFKVDSTAMGFYDNSNNGLMTFDNEGNLAVAKNLTITAGSNFVVKASPDVYDNYMFIIDSGATNTENLYVADSGTWSTATSGLKFDLTNGLLVKGKITATEFNAIGNIDDNPQYHFKVDNQHLGFYEVSTDNNTTTTTGLLTVVTDNGEVSISLGADLTLDSEKNIYVDTDNFFLNTSSPNDIFILRKRLEETNEDGTPKYEDYLTYNPNSGLTIKGDIVAENGRIGGWTITATSLERTAGGGTAYLHHETDKAYAIFVNTGQFKVDYDGNVWLQSLIVDDQVVDFTKAFTDAVRLWGEWNGDKFTAYAQFYGNKKLTAFRDLDASFEIRGGRCFRGTVSGSGSYSTNGMVLFDLYIDGKKKDWTVTFTEDANFNCSDVFHHGYEAACNKVEPPAAAGQSVVIKTPEKTAVGPDSNGMGQHEYYLTLIVDTPSADGGYARINEGLASHVSLPLDGWYNAGWNDCLAKCQATSTTAYTITSGNGTTTHYVADSSQASGYRSVGTGWHKVDSDTFYTLNNISTR